MREIGKTILKVKLGSAYCAKYMGCKNIQNSKKLENLLRQGAKNVGAIYLNSCRHDFTPEGASAIVLLSESHYAFHSWPENEIVTATFYTCGKIDSKKVIRYFGEKIKAREAWCVQTNFNANKVKTFKQFYN